MKQVCRDVMLWVLLVEVTKCLALLACLSPICWGKCTCSYLPHLGLLKMSQAAAAVFNSRVMLKAGSDALAGTAADGREVEGRGTGLSHCG